MFRVLGIDDMVGEIWVFLLLERRNWECRYTPTCRAEFLRIGMTDKYLFLEHRRIVLAWWASSLAWLTASIFCIFANYPDLKGKRCCSGTVVLNGCEC